MKSAIEKDIKFSRELPKFNDDLREIDPKYNNVLIFERFEAIQSPIVPRLFTKGRHRPTSIILQLKNMFPKGKFNTDLSWNAQYMAPFVALGTENKSVCLIRMRPISKLFKKGMVLP